MFIEREILGRRVAGVLGATHCGFLVPFSVMVLDSIWMKLGYTRRQRGRNLEIGGVGCVGWVFYCFRVHA